MEGGREGGREGGLSKICCIFFYHDSLEECGRKNSRRKELLVDNGSTIRGMGES